MKSILAGSVPAPAPWQSIYAAQATLAENANPVGSWGEAWIFQSVGGRNLSVYVHEVANAN
jgi:hypothetical protein